MADKPANAGASGGLAGDLALPPVVHHGAYPRPVPGYRAAPTAPAPAPATPPHLRPAEARGHRRRPPSRSRTHAAARPEAAEPPSSLSWLAYLVVLAGVVTGLLIASHSSQDALAGTAVIAGTLLVAAVARLVLPPRYAGPLCTRSRIYDVLALAVLGSSVLAIVLTLP